MSKRLKKKNIVAEKRKLVLNKNMQEAFIHFLEYHPAKRINRNLRRMLLEHLTHQGSIESIYLHETLVDLEGLFNLLDVAEEEWQPNPLN
jgi:hypothetical protein